MNVITLQRKQNGWFVSFEGPGAAAFIDFFGTNSIPTGYSSWTDAVDVACGISDRYYGWTVRIVNAAGDVQGTIG